MITRTTYRPAAAGVLAGALAGGLLIGSSGPAAAAPGPQIRGAETAVRVAVGTRATDAVTGVPVDTKVTVERRAGDSWQAVRTFRPDTGGAMTVIYPRAELGMQRYRLVPTSPTATGPGTPVFVQVTGYQEVPTLSGWPSGDEYLRKGTSLTRELVASPSGASAELQQRLGRGKPWRVIATPKIAADGSLRVNPGRAAVGTRQYRVAIPRQDLVGQRITSAVWTVVGYGKVPPTQMLPDLLNRLLEPLGIPGVGWSSVRNGATARAACVAAELSGMRPSREQPGPRLRARLMRTESFRRAPRGAVTGVNVSVTCQAAYFVKGGRLLRAVPVSTGRAGYPTGKGTFRIFRSVNGTETSTQFPSDHWNMYRSLYFHGGEALHGSYSDEYVYTYPDSHGCVRMLHRDIDWLWRKGWTIGTTVRVYGNWR